LAEGSLKPTDSSWYEGLDGWKPLGELMSEATAPAAGAPAPPPGGGTNCPQCSATLAPNAIFCTQCGFNLQTGQGTQSIPGMGMPVAGQPAGPAIYSPLEEEDIKATNLMYIGIAMIVGVVLPLYAGKISFPNFDLSGASAKAVINLLWPLVVGITMVSMAKTTRDPVRCSVALGLSLFYLMFQFFSDSVSVMSIGGGFGGGGLPPIGGPSLVFLSAGWD